MSDIDIRKSHAMTVKQAKAAVEAVARRIAQKFDVEYAWEGSTLEFTRAGVEGHINVSRDQVHVRARLGFLLGMLKAPIEQEIRRQLDAVFADGD